LLPNTFNAIPHKTLQSKGTTSTTLVQIISEIPVEISI